MSNAIFDSHAHYDDDAFAQDRHTLLPALHRNGVCTIINVGADLESSKASIALAKQYSFVYAAVGIHPCEVKNAPTDYIEQLLQLVKQPKVVAIGEIGLDYHYQDNAPKQVQVECLKAQLQLANEQNLPVIVHDREAHGDTMDLLRTYQPKGVVHCFSGSVEMANELIKLGMHIGLGGAVTFKNAKTPVAVATQLPLSAMLLETDAPYMAPVPFRGNRCDSSMILYTAKKIAAARNEQGHAITAAQLLEITRTNAANLFGIPLGGTL